MVSIHASVKDATLRELSPLQAYSVSIHASVKDATYRTGRQEPKQKRFNPRICKRCDYRIRWTGNLLIVSIHASVKDATITLVINLFILKFQSTHL